MLEKIQHALAARELARHGTNAKTFSARTRNELIRDAVWITCCNIVEQKPAAARLTAVMQFATNEELAAMKASEPEKPRPPAPAEASPFQMDWFREHFPDRCT